MANEEFQAIVLKELKALRGDVIGVKEDLAGVKEDVASVKDDLAEVKEDVANVKDDLAGVKEDLVGVKEDVAELKIKVEKIDTKLDAVYEQTAFLTEFKEDSKINFEKFEQENRRLKEIVGRHELEIQALKEKIG
ncbi:MAG: hypothetical protein GX023_09310 [Tissierellia bacterium]|nr:hypothetical protein [Tissierellia bacterium]